MLKKILSIAILGLSATQFTQAGLIKLNNHDPEVCKQQLLSSHDVKPVIFMDIKGDKLSERLQTIYQQISLEHPKSSFFIFSTDGKEPSEANLKTAQACIDAKTLTSSYVYAYVIEPKSTKSNGEFIAADFLKLSDASTKKDIVDFIRFE